MTSRRLLLIGLALLPFARVARAETFATQAMTVADMQANGGLIVDIRTPEEWAESGVIEGAGMPCTVEHQQTRKNDCHRVVRERKKQCPRRHTHGYIFRLRRLRIGRLQV